MSNKTKTQKNRGSQERSVITSEKDISTSVAQPRNYRRKKWNFKWHTHKFSNLCGKTDPQVKSSDQWHSRIITCNEHHMKEIIFLIYKELLQLYKKRSITRYFKSQRVWTDSSQERKCKWVWNIIKDVQHTKRWPTPHI